MTEIKLVIDNSLCKITGLSVQLFKKLKDLLSYSEGEAAAFFSGRGRSKRYLLGARGDFPTGLLYLVKQFLAEHKIKPMLSDLRVVPVPDSRIPSVKLAHVPYPEQIEAAKAAKAAGRGIICAPTGVGKSVIIALIIDALKVPTLVVVPSLELRRQLTESLRQAFGADVVGGLGSLIAVENVDALSYKEKLEGYHAVITDEFHHSGAKTYRKLNQKAWSGVYHKLGTTATPFRAQEHERLLLESVLSEVIYRIDYKTAVAKGYIVPIEAYFVDLPCIPVKGSSWAEVYNTLVINNELRNDIIRDLLAKLSANNISTICLVKQITHGEKLAGHDFAFANGLDENTPQLIEAFNQMNPPVLIGTTGVLGEGVDTRPAEYIIIAGLGKSKNQFMQSVGRGFRRYPGKDSCKIIIFRDPSHKWMLAHMAAQKKILLDEYGIKVVKL